MNITRLTLAAFIAGSTASAVFAQEAPALPGSKANIVLSLSATSEVGGFLIKDKDLEKLESQGIVYDESSIANPLGYDAEETEANHYGERETTNSKNFGTKAEPDVYPTKSVFEESSSLFTQKFTNKDFIQALIDREYVPGVTNVSSYKLVAIFPADFLETENEPPVLFFIENKTGSIHYVGRQAHHASAVVEDALTLDFNNGAEKYSFKATTTYKTKKGTDGEIEEDTEGTTTFSESFSGKIEAYVDIFPGYSVFNPETEETEFIRTGASFYFGGLLSFSGRFDNNAGFYLTTSVNLPAAGTSGGFYDDDYFAGSGEDHERGQFATGSFMLNGVTKIADITPYLDALPESLAELKAEILANYAAEEGEEEEVVEP